MKIAVIGAGVIGVTTAHALSQSGAEVHVFEQTSSASQGAGYSHHGMYGEQSVQAFFNPSFVQDWVLSFFGKSKNIHWSLFNKVSEYLLVVKAIWRARKKVHHLTMAQLQSLAHYSSSLSPSYLSDIEFEQGKGLTAVYIHADAFNAACESIGFKNLKIQGDDKKIQIFDPVGLFKLNPALAQNQNQNLRGAVMYPDEGYGNCALFTKQLKLQHQKNGVCYRMNTKVTRLETKESKWLLHIEVKKGNANSELAVEQPLDELMSSQVFDAVIVAAGVDSASLLASISLNFPVLQIHACTVTLPCRERVDSPSSSLLDVAAGGGITPIGNRVRVSGHYLLGSPNKTITKGYKALGKIVQRWYPYATKMSEATYDTSVSSVAIDSKPIVGGTCLPGLYVNFAHGPSSWALSFGCAQALSDMIFRVASRFDMEPFSPHRFK